MNIFKNNAVKSITLFINYEECKFEKNAEYRSRYVCYSLTMRNVNGLKEEFSDGNINVIH